MDHGREVKEQAPAAGDRWLSLYSVRAHFHNIARARIEDAQARRYEAGESPRREVYAWKVREDLWAVDSDVYVTVRTMTDADALAWVQRVYRRPVRLASARGKVT